MAAIYRSDAAREDLIEHYVYLATEAGEAVADRFLDNVESTFDLLAGQPLLGSPLQLRNTSLGDIRKWRVSGFDNILVFYLARANGVKIVRVLHRSRDWWALLGMELS